MKIEEFTLFNVSTNGGNYSVPPKKVSSEISVKYKPVWGYEYSRIVLV